MTTHVPVGATPAATRAAIENALSRAVAGDVITLAAGQLYEVDRQIELPDKGALADYVTIRSDAADADLPADGVRIDPSYAPHLPKIRSLSNRAAIETVVGAQKYKLMFLEFHANLKGFGEVIMLGHNDSSQEFFDDQPNDIIVDRVWIHGDPVCGQKRGIGLNGRNLVVRNSRIEGIFGVGQDAQACATFNASGPISMINNYMAASGYAYIAGGDAPKMFTWATVATTPAPTTSSATLSTFRTGHTVETMRVGQHISIRVLGGTERRHTYVRSINAATNEITFDPIDTVPDAGEGTRITHPTTGEILGYTGSDIVWGEQPIGLTVQGNHVTRPLSWLDPIMPSPQNVSAAPGTGGSLPAGTYYYKVVAYEPNGYNNVDTYSAPSLEVSAAVGADGTVQISWDPVPGAAQYRVYGRQQGSVSIYFTTTGTSFTDTGAAGTPASSIPSPARPVLKNLFEIKFAMDVQIDSNVFENHWPGSESGYAIWIKSNHYGDYASFVKTRNVVIENNIIRHVAGAFSLLARIGNDPARILAGRLENVVIRNNLVHDSDSNWLYGKASVYGVKLEGDVQGFTFEHNTFLHGMKGALYFDKFSSPVVNAVVRHNLFRKEQYGVFGNGTAAGIETLDHYVTEWTDNVMAGGSGYPAGTQQPSYPQFEAHFVNYDNGTDGDYRLAPGSAYIGGATDGKDLGCDMTALLAATANTISGGPGAQPPSVTTTSVPNGLTATIPLNITLRADSTNFSFSAASVAGSAFAECDSAFRHRLKLDLTNVTSMRLVFGQLNNPTATARMVLQYSLNGSSGWTDSGVFTNFGTINMVHAGSWIAIPVAMKADVWLRFGATGGNGNESPEFANVYLQVK